MLKKSTILAGGRLFNLVSSCGVLPLVWNHAECQFSLSESPKLLKIWSSVVFIHFAYLFFLAFRLFYGMTYMNRDGYQNAFHLIYSASYVLSGCSHLNVVLSRSKIVNYLNVLVWMNLKWKRRYYVNDKTTRLIFGGIFCSACAHILIGIVALYVDPLQPQYITSVVLPRIETGKHSVVIVLAVLFEIFLLLEHWISISFQAVINLVYIQTSILCLRDTRTELASSPSIYVLYRYRWIQYFHSCYLEVSSREFLCGFEFAVLYASIVTSYSSMKFHSSDSTPTHIYLMFPLGTLLSAAYQFLMHSKAALVYKNSRKIYVLKRTKILENPSLCKYQRSCRPMMVKVGSIMRFKNLTPLKFFNFIVIWTAKLYFYTA